MGRLERGGVVGRERLERGIPERQGQRDKESSPARVGARYLRQGEVVGGRDQREREGVGERESDLKPKP